MDAGPRRTPGGIEIAGWLLKARRDVWDVVGAMARGEPISSWRLTATYRVELIAVGDPVVLWLTGAATERPPAGIWAVGSVAGDVDEAPGDGGGWIDTDARDVVRPRLPVEMTVLADPLTRSELAGHAAFAGAEILTAPRVGNPGVLRAGELALVAALLEGAGDDVDRALSRWSLLT